MGLPRLSLRAAAVLVPALAVAAAAVVWRLAGPVVDTHVVAPTRLAQTVVVSGRVLAPAKVEIGSTITGRAERVPVVEGERVVAGQTLVELEFTLYTISV